MGREIRMVPPNYEHPKTERHYGHGLSYQPMYDQTFAEAAAEWKAGFAEWEAGERDECCDEESRLLEYWEWETSPPERAYYRTYSDAEATWFQVWETVSEGTPVTPPFATREELIDHLVAYGDDWDQKRGNGGWLRANAEQFVGRGFAFSAVVKADKVYAPRDGEPA